MGPLKGIKIIELAGIGPGPFCATLFADLGADVIRVDRLGSKGALESRFDVTMRSRRSIGVNLKNPEGVEAVLRLVEQAEALTEGFRPGVTERLGLGPDVCLARNQKLVYGRMTGWGQSGPMSSAAGHDINYISLTGALDSIRRVGERPVPPLNLVGDFGGGALYLAVGVLAGILEARTSGKGQIVDAAMIDGASNLMSIMYGMLASGFWTTEPGTNLLDTGAPYYDAYETSDGKFISIGSIEPQFYAELIERMGLAGENLPKQNDRSQWPAMKERFAAVFRSKTRQEWCDIMEGTDVCFAPVLSISEAAQHPHNTERKTFVEVEGVVQPAPAPRFSRTAAEISRPPTSPGMDTEEGLLAWGFSAREISRLREAGAVG